MPKILIARADGKRWKQDTLIDVYPDTDNMHSFPEPLYTVIKAEGKIDDIRAKFQAQAGIVIDISSGKQCANTYVKNLNASAVTVADKAVLESKAVPVAEKDAVFTKMVKIASIPVEDIKAEAIAEPKNTDGIVNDILAGK